MNSYLDGKGKNDKIPLIYETISSFEKLLFGFSRYEKNDRFEKFKLR